MKDLVIAVALAATGWCCLSGTPASATVYSGEDASREERFANPPASARILPLHHGRPDDKARVDAELAKLKEQGFGGFAGNVNFSSNYFENATDWETLRYTLGKAHELGQTSMLPGSAGELNGARRVMSEASEYSQRHRKPGDKRPVYQVSVRTRCRLHRAHS